MVSHTNLTQKHFVTFEHQKKKNFVPQVYSMKESHVNQILHKCSNISTALIFREKNAFDLPLYLLKKQADRQPVRFHQYDIFYVQNKYTNGFDQS